MQRSFRQVWGQVKRHVSFKVRRSFVDFFQDKSIELTPPLTDESCILRSAPENERQ